MTFDSELAAAFGEVCKQGMPVGFKLTGERHSGIVRSGESLVALREPGYESIAEVIIAAPVGQFIKPPSDQSREVVEVLEGPNAGVYVLVAVQSDAAMYYLNCKAAE